MYLHSNRKAAQTRHLADFCLTLAQRHRAGDGHRAAFRFGDAHRMAAHSVEHCDLLVELFEGLKGFTRSCSARPFVIHDCRTSMYRYLQALEGLHNLWRNGAPPERLAALPFHIRPKAHVCQHLAEEKIDAFGNPSSFWCYRDEDFVGSIKAIANKTKHPATLEEKMLQKLRILAAIG